MEPHIHVIIASCGEKICMTCGLDIVTILALDEDSCNDEITGGDDE